MHINHNLYDNNIFIKTKQYQRLSFKCFRNYTCIKIFYTYVNKYRSEVKTRL